MGFIVDTESFIFIDIPLNFSQFVIIQQQIQLILVDFMYQIDARLCIIKKRQEKGCTT